MKADGHISVARTEVRGRPRTQHHAVRVERGRTHVVCAALGPPRLWSRTLRAALDGFESGLEHGRGDEREPRMFAALGEARSAVTRLGESLIEHRGPDAVLLAISIEHGHAHVVGAGPARAYLHRRGEAQRLTPRPDTEEGLRLGTPFHCATPLQQGDLLLAGSASAFSEPAVAQVTASLRRDPDATPSVLAHLLTEPASEQAVGAAAVAMRMR